MPCMFLYALPGVLKIYGCTKTRKRLYFLPGRRPGLTWYADPDAEYSFDLAPSGSEVEITFFGLRGMDELKIITDLGEENIYCPGCCFL